ncbi:MAG: HU family DNA-binding protein [Gammaproteobacteria bacterium]|nr:HU family DNA-binding protein [Gammaproteobacteria bacterium]
MNKNDLIAAIAKNSGLSMTEARQALEAILDKITRALANGETISLTGFGSFSVKTRAARTVRNPHSGHSMQIPGMRAPVFKAGKALKDAQNELDTAPVEIPGRRPTGKSARRSMRGEGPLEMTGPPEPEHDERRVNAQIRVEGIKRNTFVCGTDNVIRCWIGLPDENASHADHSLPPVSIPEKGLPLEVQMRWRGESKPISITLPKDRTARTMDCDFTIHVPKNERYVSAEIIFRYRGSVFEFIRLEAFAIAAGKTEEAHQVLTLQSVLDARQSIEIEDRQEVNTTILWGEDRSEVTGPHEKGSPTLRVFGSGSPEKFDLSDAGNAIDWLNDELFITEKSLVRKQAGAPGESQIKSDDAEVIRILRKLAEHGTELFNQLTLQGFKDPGQRIQLINTEPAEYVPIEFVYDRGFPKQNATLCQDGLDALNSDATDCPVCKPANKLTLKERDGADKICPFGFWSLSKVIERRDPKSGAADSNNNNGERPSNPTRERRSLPAIDDALFASSGRVPESERAKIAEDLSGFFTSPGIALDWAEWKTLLEEKQPPLLVVLPHHHIESKQDYLEIGIDSVPDDDRLLPRGKMTNIVVNPEGIEPGPVVILLGCRTAAETETGYVHLARRFQQLSTAIVMGTLAKILGRHAAPVARELVAELVSVNDADADFGTIMLRVRRRMLAKGYLMAMCLVALGDAEWRLTPRSTSTSNQESTDV